MYSHRIVNGIKNPRLIISFILGMKIARIISDKTFLRIKFKEAIGKNLDLNNPQSFNEKIQWLKLNDRNPAYTQLADKYEVRKFIKETIGEKYLIPLLGVYDSFEEIDFVRLPNQFVLKPNHTSGDIFFCKNKSNINYAELRKLIKKWLKTEYFWVHREWSYKNIKAKVICEEYMVDESGIELKDYKLLTFGGKVKCSYVCLNRNTKEGMNVDFYDMEWKSMPFELRVYPNSGKMIARPKEYEKMIKFAEKLSQGIPFVRVDFYETNGQLYFGELTFYPSSGFQQFAPESYDYLLGSWLNLPI